MGKRKNKVNNLEFIDSALSNELTYYDYLDRMKTIVLSMFEWVNLPDSMNERYLEKCLYYKGVAGALDTDTMGLLNTQVSSNGYLNHYGLPSSLHFITYNGLNWDRDLYISKSDDSKQRYNEGIYIMNDREGLPTAGSVELFAYRLYMAEKSCDVNISAQRTPILLLCSDKQRVTMENLYSQYDGNRPFIYGDKNGEINLDTIKAIKTDAPYIADKLILYKKEIWNEFLTFIGVNNIQTEKRERLVSDEVNQNNEVINLYLQNHLVPRQLACKQMNELFGLTGTDKEISVRIRSDLHNIIKNAESIVNDYKETKEIIDEEG